MLNFIFLETQGELQYLSLHTFRNHPPQSILLLPADAPRPEMGRGTAFTGRLLPGDMAGHCAQPRVAPRQKGQGSHAQRQVRLTSCKSPLMATRPFGRRTSRTQVPMAAGCGQRTTAYLQEGSSFFGNKQVVSLTTCSQNQHS